LTPRRSARQPPGGMTTRTGAPGGAAAGAALAGAVEVLAI
jgi:hypothetical protein